MTDSFSFNKRITFAIGVAVVLVLLGVIALNLMYGSRSGLYNKTSRPQIQTEASLSFAGDHESSAIGKMPFGSVAARRADSAASQSMSWTSEAAAPQEVADAIDRHLKFDHTSHLRSPQSVARHASWLVGVDDKQFFAGLLACRREFEAENDCAWKQRLVLVDRSAEVSQLVHSEIAINERTDSKSCHAWARCVQNMWAGRSGPSSDATKVGEYYAFEISGGSRFAPGMNISQERYYERIAEHSGENVRRMREFIEMMEDRLKAQGWQPRTLLTELERHGFRGKVSQNDPTQPPEIEYEWESEPNERIKDSLKLLLPLFGKRSSLALMIQDDWTSHQIFKDVPG